MRSHTAPTTLRSADEQKGQPSTLAQVLEQVQNLSLDAQVQRGHALVEHQEFRDRAKARASTMRWRRPPLKLPGLRVASDALSPTSSSNLATEGPCLSARASTASGNAAPTVMLGLRAEKGS